MGALAQQSSSFESLPPGVRWLDIATVAKLMKFSERAARRRAECDWSKSGFARMRQSGRAGRSCWHVRSDADPSLAIARWPQNIPSDARQLSEENRRQLARRKEIYDGFERAVAQATGDGRSTKEAIELYVLALPTCEQIDAATLYRWRKSYRRDGVNGLIDRRWLQSNERDTFEEFYAAMIHWRRKKTRLSMTICYELAREQAINNGWTYPQLWTARRYLKSLAPQVTKIRDGHEAAKESIEGHHERDYGSLRSNQIWCGDSHTFDVIVRHEGRLVRPFITGWEDLRSRKIVGYVIDAADPNEDTVIAAFRSGCITHGVPECVYIDNGKNWDSHALQGMTKKERRASRLEAEGDAGQLGGIFGQIGVSVTHAIAYNARAKPIERAFRTVCERFSKLCPTYVGNSPDTKPDDLAKLLKGKDVPTLDELIEDFADWLEADYHAREHKGQGMDGMTPAEAFNAHLESKRVATVEQLDLLLMKISRSIKVGRNGVTYKGRRYFADELLPLIGKDVRLRCDPRDISNVTVWTEDERFICRAPVTKLLPFKPTEDEWREAEGLKKRRRKLARSYHEIRPVLHEDPRDLLFQARAQRRRREAEQNPQPEPPAPTLRPVQSKVIDAMEALRESEGRRRLRLAAGAETLKLEDIGSVFADRRPARESNDSALSFSDLGKLFAEQR